MPKCLKPTSGIYNRIGGTKWRYRPAMTNTDKEKYPWWLEEFYDNVGRAPEEEESSQAQDGSFKVWLSPNTSDDLSGPIGRSHD